MKLTDETHSLKGTSLEQVALTGDSLDDYRSFWDTSASVDAVKAIADRDDERSFDESGRNDAQALRDIVGPGDTVLEIGCGMGRILRHVAGMCGQLHGVDISAEMVARGRERLADLANVTLHVGNGYDLANFADASFDVVYSNFVFQHMPKTIAYNYFTEVHRVLRPGGRFWFYVPNLLRHEHLEGLHFFAQPYFVTHPYPMNYYTPSEVCVLLMRAGLRVQRMTEDMSVLAVNEGPPAVSVEVSEALRAWEGLSTQLATEVAQVRVNTAALEKWRRRSPFWLALRLAARMRRAVLRR